MDNKSEYKCFYTGDELDISIGTDILVRLIKYIINASNIKTGPSDVLICSIKLNCSYLECKFINLAIDKDKEHILLLNKEYFIKEILNKEYEPFKDK